MSPSSSVGGFSVFVFFVADILLGYSRSDKSPFTLSEAIAAFLGVFPYEAFLATFDSSVAVAAAFWEAAAARGAAASARSLRACFDSEAILEDGSAAVAGDFVADAVCLFLAGVDAMVAGDRSCLSAMVIFFPSSDDSYFNVLVAGPTSAVPAA